VGGPHLVLLAAGNEEDLRVLGVEQCVDRVLAPATTLDLPVPDIPVTRTRFTVAA
jgi:hypothetical protein